MCTCRFDRYKPDWVPFSRDPAAASKNLVIPFFSRSRISVSLHPPLSSFLPPSCCVCPLPPHTIHPGHCPGRSPGKIFCAGCILFLLPLASRALTPKAPFSAHALSASSLTYFSLSATAPRPLSSPRRQQRRRQWKKICTLAAST